MPIPSSKSLSTPAHLTVATSVGFIDLSKDEHLRQAVSLFINLIHVQDEIIAEGMHASMQAERRLQVIDYIKRFRNQISNIIDLRSDNKVNKNKELLSRLQQLEKLNGIFGQLHTQFDLAISLQQKNIKLLDESINEAQNFLNEQYGEEAPTVQEFEEEYRRFMIERKIDFKQQIESEIAKANGTNEQLSLRPQNDINYIEQFSDSRILETNSTPEATKDLRNIAETLSKNQSMLNALNVYAKDDPNYSKLIESVFNLLETYLQNESLDSLETFKLISAARQRNFLSIQTRHAAITVVHHQLTGDLNKLIQSFHDTLQLTKEVANKDFDAVLAHSQTRFTSANPFNPAFKYLSAVKPEPEAEEQDSYTNAKKTKS